ncbi:MAG: hypothetical protein HOO67_04015 [Candidatus Peribacteraceae bacterium]|nr:hypothetical protein [Candidatus Peribacteraceae bacterium]
MTRSQTHNLHEWTEQAKITSSPDGIAAFFGDKDGIGVHTDRIRMLQSAVEHVVVHRREAFFYALIQEDPYVHAYVGDRLQRSRGGRRRKVKQAFEEHEDFGPTVTPHLEKFGVLDWQLRLRELSILLKHATERGLGPRSEAEVSRPTTLTVTPSRTFVEWITYAHEVQREVTDSENLMTPTSVEKMHLRNILTILRCMKRILRQTEYVFLNPGASGRTKIAMSADAMWSAVHAAEQARDNNDHPAMGEWYKKLIKCVLEIRKGVDSLCIHQSKAPEDPVLKKTFPLMLEEPAQAM